METETPVRKTEEGEGTIEGAGEEVEGRRATRGAPEDGKQQLQKVRAPKRPRDTDASLAALNLQQPFNVPQYRFTPVIPFESVTLSHFDRAPQLRIAKDALTVSGHKGYRLIRGTHGVSQGAWYCEATVMEDFQDNDLEERFLNAKGHCRLGWARSAAHIQMPVGSDRFGYSMCLCTGHIVHERRPREYSSPSEDAGTVIGFYIYLPERNHPEPAPVAQEKRDQFWWKNSGKEYYLDEDKDTGTEIHDGSVVRFFVNGQDQGKAFENVQAGIYYPAASLYMGGQVTYNFGPDFKYPMPDKPDGVTVRAISDLAELQREHMHKVHAFVREFFSLIST